MAEPRLAQRQGELIDRSQEVTFQWEGRPVTGYAGDTIASALYAAGTRVFSRSFKYHRPRGLMCCSGQCPNCMVEVDGEPTVRACMTPVKQGMDVKHLNAWPSLQRDFLHLVGRLTPSFGMQVGFYYKTFIHPRRAWPLYEKILRNAAGLGKLDPDHRRTERFDKVHRHVDVLVIGGGEAGLEAAAEAAEQGRHVALVEEGLALGGQLAWGGPRSNGRLAALIERVNAAGVEILQPAYAGGVYEGLLVPVYQGRTMHRFRPAELVIATGSIEQPLVFGNNDLPGIMLASGARRLVNQFRLMPWEQAVVLTSSDEGLEAALDLADGGVNVLAVADSRRDADGSVPRGRRHRVPGRLPAVAGEGLEGGLRRRRHARRRAPHAGLRPAGHVRRQRRPDRARQPGRRRHPLRPRPAPLRARRAARGHARRGCRGRLGRGRRRGAGAGAEDRLQAGRLLLRGRHHEGHRAVAGRGLQLAGAVQALHDRDHGPLPGAHVPPQLRARDRRSAGPRPRCPASRRHHLAAAAQPHHFLAAGGPRLRAGEAHVNPPLARRARRQDAVGGRLEAPLRLRRRRQRGGRRARVAGPDRRIHAGQADRARARRRRLPRAALPEPVRRHEAGPRPLRHRLRRRRLDHRRRHRRPAVGAGVLRDHHVVGRRRHGAVVYLVERRLEDGLRDRQRHLDHRRLQPGRPARAHGVVHADRLRPLERGVPVPGRRARPDRRRPLPGAADRIRGRARLRAAPARRRRRAPLGEADGGRRAVRREAVRPWSPSGC